MDTKKLRQKILDLAIRGKLVPQDPNDEPASVLLERIRAEKERLVKEGKIKKSKASKTSDTPHYEQVPFEVPSSWVWTTIDELCDVVRGGSPRPAGDAKYYNGSIPFLKVADLTKDDGVYVYKAEYTIKEAGLKKTRHVNAKTLLLTNSGATLGVPKITTFPTTFNDGIAAFLNLNEEIQLYLYWFLKSKTDSFRKIDQGAAQPNLNTDLIKSIPIPLPPLTEQYRIVAEIEKWFSLIDQIEQGKAELNAVIKQTKSKILDLAIHGKLVPQDPNDEPASELLKRINPKAEITCDNGHYENLPKGWGLYKLGDVARFITDFVANGSFASLREHVKYYDGKEYAIIVRTKDFQNNFTKDLIYTDKHGYDFLSKSKLFGGELMLPNIGASIGKVFIIPNLDYPMTLGPNSVMISFEDDITKSWAYYVFLSPFGQELLLAISSSTAQGKFNKTDLRNIFFPLPPLAEQRRIVDAIDKAFAKLDVIMESL